MIAKLAPSPLPHRNIASTEGLTRSATRIIKHCQGSSNFSKLLGTGLSDPMVCVDGSDGGGLLIVHYTFERGIELFEYLMEYGS